MLVNKTFGQWPVCEERVCVLGSRCESSVNTLPPSHTRLFSSSSFSSCSSSFSFPITSTYFISMALLDDFAGLVILFCIYATIFYLRRFIWISILGNPQPRLSQCFGLSQCTPVSNKPVTGFFAMFAWEAPFCKKYVFWASLKFPLFCERAFQAKLPAFLHIQRLNFHCNGVVLQRVIWPLLQLLPATLHVTTHYITPPTLYHHSSYNYITPPTLYYPSHNNDYNYITPPTKNITSPLPQLFAPIFLPQIDASEIHSRYNQSHSGPRLLSP